MDVEPVPAKRGRPKKANSEGPARKPVSTTRKASTAASTAAQTKIKSTRQASTTTRTTVQGSTSKPVPIPVKKATKATTTSATRSPKSTSTKRPKSAAPEEPIAKSTTSTASKATVNSVASTSRPQQESKILKEVALKEAENKVQSTASKAAEADNTMKIPSAAKDVPAAATSPPAMKFSSAAAARASSVTSGIKPPAQAPPSIKQLNAYAVNSISARAHPGRPEPNISTGNVARQYKPFARRVTTIMVALPIVAVTSYALYDRLILGNDRKYLLNPKPKVVED